MKRIFLVFASAVIFLSGCAHKMTIEEIANKYTITILTDLKDVSYEIEEGKDNKLNNIMNSVEKKLNAEFKSSATRNDLSPIEIHIAVSSYEVMLKRIPPTRHWVTYKVEVMDPKNMKLLGRFENEDGQPTVSDVVNEITDNIYQFSLKTMQTKLD